MKNRIYTFGFLVLCIIFAQEIVAQNYEDELEARRSARKLAESVLIVRLPVNGPKIRYLTQALEKAVEPKARKNIREELEGAKELNYQKFNAIRRALQNQYRFSAFLILPDSAYLAFTKGKQQVFLGEDGQIDPSLSCNNKDHFYLICGENDDQWVLVDQNLNRLDRPFPYRSTIFLSGIRRVFSRNNYYEKQIKWFNLKLKSLI